MDPIDLQTLQPEVLRGPLFERQRSLGASFYEDYGRLWTASFDDPIEEYQAAREAAVIWDVSPLSKWHLTGPDTLAAFDRLTTRPTAKDDPGQVRYLLALNDDGLLVEEGTRYLFAPDEGWLIGNEDRPAMAAHILDALSGLRVHVENRTDEVPSVAVQGPRSCEVLATFVDADIAGLGYYRAIATTTVTGAPAMVSRTGFSGELGYEVFLFGGPDQAGRLWGSVLEAGARPMGLDAVEMLRIEAGFVIADEDYVTGRSDPVELSLDAFIDLDGTGFIGRDAVAERMASPARRLMTLSFDDPGEADPTSCSHQPVMRDGTEIGETLSVQRTPRRGTIALAVIDTAWAIDGTPVMVGTQAATVQPRPIDGGDRARRARP